MTREGDVVNGITMSQQDETELDDSEHVRTASVANLAQPSHPGVIAAQRRVLTERALELRLAGASLAQIASTLNTSPHTIDTLIRKSLMRSAERENVTAMRELESQRLDALLLSWAQRARTDPRAADIVLRISERRSRLAGLDMPMRVDIGSVIAQIAANEGWDVESTLHDVRELARDQRLITLEADATPDTPDAGVADASQPVPESASGSDEPGDL